MVTYCVVTSPVHQLAPGVASAEPLIRNLFLLHPTYPTILLQLASTTDTAVAGAGTNPNKLKYLIQELLFQSKYSLTSIGNLEKPTKVNVNLNTSNQKDPPPQKKKRN